MKASRLGVRPRPKYGESLTGYMMRVAMDNDINAEHFIRSIKKQPSQVIRNGSYSLDLFPKSMVQTEEVAFLVNKQVESLEKLTFLPVVEKIYSAEEIKSYSASIRKCISPMIVKDRRRFCPLCLRGGREYQILWQVKEIEICDIHFTKLTSHCSLCEEKQPYISENLAAYGCTQGLHDLRNEDTQIVEQDAVITVQIRKYDDWRFLVDPKATLTPDIAGMGKFEALAVMLIYVTQTDKSRYRQTVNPILTRHEVYRFNKLICHGESIPKMKLERILQIIRLSQMSVREFSNFTVPLKFVRSIYQNASEHDVISDPRGDPEQRQRGRKYDQEVLSREVQQAIDLFLIQDRTITKDAISNYVNTSISTIAVNGFSSIISDAAEKQKLMRKKSEEKRLWELAQNYIENKNQEGDPLTVAQVAAYLGMQIENLKSQYPKLGRWISEQVKLNNIRRREEKIDHYIQQVPLAIAELTQKGERITYDRIASILGESHQNLRSSYPEIISFIDQTKQ